jgi:hypothetical protein
MKTLFFIITASGLVYLIISSVNMELFSFSPELTASQARSAQLKQAAQQIGAEQANETPDILAKIEALAETQRTLKADVERLAKAQQQQRQVSSSQPKPPLAFKTAPVTTDTKANTEPTLIVKGLPFAQDNRLSAEAATPVFASGFSGQFENASAGFDAANIDAGGNQRRNFTENDTTITNDSTQQKRLQQQAILRDLAQKRELAAIGALQNAAR